MRLDIWVISELNDVIAVFGTAIFAGKFVDRDDALGSGLRAVLDKFYLKKNEIKSNIY